MVHPICPECGYDLAGLPPPPAAVRCPECGGERDDGELVVWGLWLDASGIGDRDSSPGPLNTSIALAVLLFVALAIFLAIFAPPHPLKLLLATALPFAASSAIAWEGWRRERALDALPARAQLRIRRSGYSVRRGAGRPRFRRWQPGHAACVEYLLSPPSSPVVRLYRQRGGARLRFAPIVGPGAGEVVTRINASVQQSGR